MIGFGNYSELKFTESKSRSITRNELKSWELITNDVPQDILLTSYFQSSMPNKYLSELSFVKGVEFKINKIELIKQFYMHLDKENIDHSIYIGDEDLWNFNFNAIYNKNAKNGLSKNQKLQQLFNEIEKDMLSKANIDLLVSLGRITESIFD